MQLSDQALTAYSKLTLADCAKIDCALVVRTVGFLHTSALHAPGGVPEEFDALHEAFLSVPKDSRNQAHEIGKREAAERKARKDKEQSVLKPAFKVEPKELKKNADVLTVKEAERIQFDFVIGRLAAGKQHFTAEEIEIVIRRELTQSGTFVINPVDREIVSSNVERWKQTAASARQNLKNEGLILWSARAQRWVIPLTEQDLKKEAKKRVENAPVRILQIKRTGT